MKLPALHLPAILTFLRRELRVLALLALGVALVSGFIQLAGEMQEGETKAFDRWLLRALRHPDNPALPIGPHWLQTAMVDITALGGVTVLTMVSVFAVAFLMLRRHYRQAAFTALATGGGAIFSTVLKALFARSRPEVVPHLVEVTSLSFPSGHSLNSAIIYLTLGVMIASSFRDRTIRIFCIASASLLVLTIGFTRVYLGVHYPTDVLGGWAVGAAWALTAGLIATVLQRSRAMEQPDDKPRSDEPARR